MKYAFASLAFGLGASAALLRRDQCSFTITASGGESGTVGQLPDGQNRIGQLPDGQNRVGGNLPTGSYSISNGQITDSQGRGCILTPPTKQFQCDEGATPTGGFSIGSNGQIYSNGSPTFYACPATDTEYNIYTQPVEGQAKCVKVELTASGCYGQSSQQSQAPQPTQVPQQSQAPQSHAPQQSQAPSSSGKQCPGYLGNEYQFPHLIVPVSQKSPNQAYGTQYNGKINSDESTIFNFDIPSSYTGTCKLEFLFPTQDQLETSSYTFSGNGQVDFKELSQVATQSTTYANQGSVKKDLGEYAVTPGSATTVATFPCPAGQAVSYEISSQSGTSLEYFQDYNPCPIGLYITYN